MPFCCRLLTYYYNILLASQLYTGDSLGVEIFNADWKSPSKLMNKYYQYILKRFGLLHEFNVLSSRQQAKTFAKNFFYRVASISPSSIDNFKNIKAIHEVCGHFMPPFADFDSNCSINDFVYQRHSYYNKSLRCHIVFCNGNSVTQHHVFGCCRLRKKSLEIFRENINRIKKTFGPRALGDCTNTFFSEVLKKAADSVYIPELDLCFRDSPVFMNLSKKFRRRAVHILLESYLLVLQSYIVACNGISKKVRRHRKNIHI